MFLFKSKKKQTVANSVKQPLEPTKPVELRLKSVLRVLKYGRNIGLPVKVSFGIENERTVEFEYQNVHYYLSEWANWTLRIKLLDKDSGEEFVVYDAPHGLHVDWDKDKIEFEYNSTSVVKWDVDGSWCKRITETILDLEKKIDNKEVQLQKEEEEQKRKEQANKRAVISEKAKRFEQKWDKK